MPFTIPRRKAGKLNVASLLLDPAQRGEYNRAVGELSSCGVGRSKG